MELATTGTLDPVLPVGDELVWELFLRESPPQADNTSAKPSAKSNCVFIMLSLIVILRLRVGKRRQNNTARYASDGLWYRHDD
jgi:hypothetical protein